MPYSIDIRDIAFDELRGIKPYHRTQIVDAIDQQLSFEPTVATRIVNLCLHCNRILNTRLPFGNFELANIAYTVM